MNPVERTATTRYEQWKSSDFLMATSEPIARHVDESKVVESLRNQHPKYKQNLREKAWNPPTIQTRKKKGKIALWFY